MVIEDDRALNEGIVFALRREGYLTRSAYSLREARGKLEEQMNLILLDINLPDGDGREFLGSVLSGQPVPVLLLTARDTEMDEKKALELGADAYLSKPFSLGVLKARIKRILNDRTDVKKLVSGSITIDKSACKVYRDGKEIMLSKLEYRLLCFFVENRNHVLSKEQILNRLWDSEGKYVDNNTVSVNISRLRKKLKGDADGPEFIRTVQGIGYIWKES